MRQLGCLETALSNPMYPWHDSFLDPDLPIHILGDGQKTGRVYTKDDVNVYRLNHANLMLIGLG